MNNEDYISNVSQFSIGKSSQVLSEEEKPVNPEQDPTEFDTSVAGATQVAGLNFGGMGKAFKKLMGRSSEDIADKFSMKAGKGPSMSLDEAETLVQAHNYAGNVDRPINKENLNLVMKNVESSDDLLRLVDIAGTGEEKFTKQTFDEISKDSDVFKDLKPIFDGKQEGLFTPKQQYGMRTLLASIGEESTVLAGRIANGDATPETLLQFKRMYSSFESIYSMARGNARETARSLNQQKMIAKTLDSKSLRGMKDALNLSGGTGGKDDAIVSLAKNIDARMRGGDSNLEALSYTKGKGLNDYTRAAVELWKNNILSGIGTHAVNVSSVAAMNLFEHMAVRPVAYGIGKAKQLAGKGNEDRIYSNEFVANMMGTTVGLKSSMGMFFDAFKTGESKFGAAANKMEHTGAIDRLAGESNIGKAWANASTLSFRLLTAEDEAMRGVAFTAELYALTARNGRQAGKTGKELLEHMDDMLKNIPDDMYNDAMAAAQKNTFTNTEMKGIVGTMAKYSKKLVQEIPALGFIMPFVNTPANLLQYAMDNSILSVVSPRLWKEVSEGGAKGDMALAKITIGTATSLSVWQYYEQGLISGSGPKDPAMRAQMEKEGWKPNAIKMNGTWHQVKRMEPFSTAMGFIANGMDKIKYASSEEEAKKAWASVSVYIAESAFDSSWMASMSDAMNILSGGDPVRDASRFATNFGASLVPYSAAVRTAEQIIEPTGSKVSDDKLADRPIADLIADRIKTNTPGYSEEIRPARYWDGSVKRPEQGGFAFAMSPFKEGDKYERDTTNTELIKNGVSVKEPSSVLTIGSTSFSLLDLTGGSDMLYDIYLLDVGRARREVLDKVVSNTRYGKLNEGPNSERFVLLQKASGAGAKKGMVDFLKDNLLASFEGNDEIRSRAELMFSADPIQFVKGLIKDLESQDLTARQKYTPTRDTFPSEGEGVPRF